MDRDLDQLVAHAWEVMATATRSVLASSSPWSYIVASADKRMRISDQVEAGARTSDARAGRVAPSSFPIAFGTTERDFTELIGLVAPGPAPVPVSGVPALDVEDFGPSLVALLDLMCALGADRQIAGAALSRVTHILASTAIRERSSVTRTDVELADLGLAPSDAWTLLTLVAGPRDSPGDSPLLSLHTHGRLTPRQRAVVASAAVACAAGLPLEDVGRGGSE